MKQSADQPQTLVGALERAARRAPRRGIGYIRKDGSAEVQTYPELAESAACALSGLRRLGVVTGDRVIIALPGNAEFLRAFWGCLLGGIVPVPLAAPGSSPNPGPAMERLINVSNVLKSPYLLCDEGPFQEQARVVLSLPDEKLLSFQDILDEQPANVFHRSAASDIAFLQFSSGSTGRPKGVVLTHRNVLTNLDAIAAGLEMLANDVGLNWMPLYHDLGLVGFHLVPLHAGLPQYHIQTRDMVLQPLRWFDGLERHLATITASPNFGYSLVLDRLDRVAEPSWDLSRVRVVLNGAEPIAVELMSRFLERTRTFGLERSSMLPVYGLAESTLAVSFPRLGENPRIETLDRVELQTHGRAIDARPDDPSAVRFVNEGFAVAGCRTRIVDDADQTVSDNVVGHIQVRGDSVTQGYYGEEQTTREAFCGPWLRTGDLGFIREGQLCVTGRAKDIIFQNGQNYYAHDVEAIAQQVKGISPGRVAVCGWHDSRAGEEKILLFLATRKPESSAALFLRVKRHVQSTLGIQLDVVIPLRANQIPRTTSGKLQRYRLLEQFELGEFDRQLARMSTLLALEEVRARSAIIVPRTVTEEYLHRLWCEEIEDVPEEVGVRDNFYDVGGKSIQAVRIISSLENHFHFTIHYSVFAANPTIEAMGAYIDRHGAALEGTGGRSARFFRG